MGGIFKSYDYVCGVKFTAVFYIRACGSMSKGGVSAGGNKKLKLIYATKSDGFMPERIEFRYNLL
jgi:hypothetical protein